MREIKFRAWDRGMFEGVVVTPDGMWTDDIVRDAWHTGNIMQYTGLKDKNGKEIYEGDIIESENKNVSGQGVIFKVVFYFNAFCIQEIDEKYSPRNPTKYFWKNYYVIGNFYENPELMPK